MITKIRIVNFRQIEDETLDLSESVVVVGPNNGGKTSLLQAIALFAVSVKEWGAKRLNEKSKATKRTGLVINLEGLLNIPISHFRELWRDLKVRQGVMNKDGKPTAKNVRIEIHAEGYTDGKPWQVGFEYDYGRDSLIYTRLTNNEGGKPYDFPEVLLHEKIGYLPSVAGLKPMEDKLEIGSILRNIGNGNTSDVLRNVCYLLYEEDKDAWKEFVETIDAIFQVRLDNPVYIPTTGLLKMSYGEGEKKNMDLSSLGSGTKQAVLLFAYILAFPNTVHLLDEPDAHLEVIRQSNIYDRLSNIAKENNTQIIVASHSESVLNSAFARDTVISGVFGKFRRENDKRKITSALRDYGYEHYLIAKQKGRILYFEGTTDFDMLKAFAAKFDKQDLSEWLQHSVYPRPVGNDVQKAIRHYAALREFIPELKAYALFDNLDRENPKDVPPGLKIHQWARKEMENYIPVPQTLYRFVEGLKMGVFAHGFEAKIKNETIPAALNDMSHPYWKKTKISDDYLTPLFEKFFDSVGCPRGLMDKSKFYQLIKHAEIHDIDGEVLDTLNEMEEHLKEDV